MTEPLLRGTLNDGRKLLIVDIRSTRYYYSPLHDELSFLVNTFQFIARKSRWKALNWLKKRTQMVRKEELHE